MVTSQFIKTTGFAELEKELGEMPKATNRNVLKRTAFNVMASLEDRMSDLAPKDEGTLSESMRTQQVRDRRSARVKAADPRFSFEVITGPAPEGKLDRQNALWQEFGTVKMAANSYARPAADVEIDGIVEADKEELTVQINKAKSRIARKLARGKIG